MSALTKNKTQDDDDTRSTRSAWSAGSAAAPEERELPSGDTMWTFRLNVDRPEGESRSRQRVDTLDCAVWSGRLQAVGGRLGGR